MKSNPSERYSCLTDKERKEADHARRTRIVIENLATACESLMGEVTGKSATDWGLVNDALWEAGKFLKGMIKD